MKKITNALFAAAFACALAFTATSASAQTTNPSEVYVATNGVVFSLDEVRKVEYVAASGYLNLTYTTGATLANYLTDNGTVLAKIKAQNPKWLTQGATVAYNPAMSRSITCTGSGNTVFGWANAGSEWINDGCALYQQAVQKSN